MRRWFWIGLGFLLLAIRGGATRGQPVVLNELVAANDRGLVDEDGDRPDWIELFNPNAVAASLAGYGLSDDSKAPFRWRIPPVILPARHHLVVFASGKDRTNSRAPLHANFSLRASGERVRLTAPNGSLTSELPARFLPADVAWGRFPDGSSNLVLLATPTPGAPNVGPGFPAVASAPSFSLPGGFLPTPSAVTLEPGQPGATVHVSRDGSEPTDLSPLATGPLAVLNRRGDPNVLSLIPGTATINQHTDGWLPPRGLVPKATILRARAFAAGSLPSPVVTRTWFVGQDPFARYQLPVVSICTDTNGLFDYNRGIYVLGRIFDEYQTANPGVPLTGHSPANYQARGPEWERPAHLEFYPTDGRLGFEQDVFLEIHGQSSRSFRQKSLGVTARGGEFRYDLFPAWKSPGDGQPLRQFPKLRLSNSGNDWSYSMLRDALSHVLVQDLPLDGLAYRPVIVFLDGEFWGIHNLREQQDGEWIEARFGIPRSEVVLCEAKDSLLEGRPGDEQAFTQLRDFIATHDLQAPTNAAYVRSQMDVDNFLLYHAVEIYLANADWPHNNIRYWRRRLEQNLGRATPGWDGRWRWMLFDTDLGFGHPWSGGYGENSLAAATLPEGRPGTAAPWSTVILRQLLKAPAFRDAFINRSADLLNSHFREDLTEAVIARMAQAIAPAMPDHIDRWRTMGDSLAGWTNQLKVLRLFASQRPIHVRQHLVSHFHLPGWARLTVDVQPAHSGRIRVHSLWIDDSLPGVDPIAPYPWRGYYFQGVPVPLTVEPRAGWRFAGWTPSDGPVTPVTDTNTVSTQVMLTGNLQVTAHFEPVPVRFELVGGRLDLPAQVELQGAPSVRYRLERSADLKNWNRRESIVTESTGSGRFLLQTDPAEPSQYFRLVLE